jgi:hypothetical protein
LAFTGCSQEDHRHSKPYNRDTRFPRMHSFTPHQGKQAKSIRPPTG